MALEERVTHEHDIVSNGASFYQWMTHLAPVDRSVTLALAQQGLVLVCFSAGKTSHLKRDSCVLWD